MRSSRPQRMRGRGREGERGRGGEKEEGDWALDDALGVRRDFQEERTIMDEGFKTISIYKHLYGFGYRLSLHFLYYCLLHI
jgi:hypothetical protein